jgi:uncharacterized Tic20 family protein
MGIAAMNDPYSPPSEPIAAPQTGLSKEERTWAMVAHLAALTGFLAPIVGNIVGPLVVWMVKKDTMPYAAAEAKEALNFNISWSIWLVLYSIVAFILTFVLVGILLWMLLGLLYIVWAVICIIAAIKANDGVPYRYPLTVRFIS